MSVAPGALFLAEADRAARRTAQRELSRPLVLEAGAGTGKTATLVARILAWCLGPGWEGAAAALAETGDPTDDRVAGKVLDGVTAITFTEAAAAEMAERVAAALAKLGAGEEVRGFEAELLGLEAAEGESRARALLAHLDRLSVSTIHAFCARLLRTYPLEAGLHPAFQVDAEKDLTEAVVREVLEDALATVYRQGEPARALAAAGLGPADLAGALAELAACGLPSAELSRPAFAAREIQAWAEGLVEAARRFVAAAGSALATVPPRSTRTHSTRCAVEAIAALDRAAGWPPRDLDGLEGLIADIAGLLDEEDGRRLADWGKGVVGTTEEKALGEARGAMVEAAGELSSRGRRLLRLSPRLFEAARAVLRPLLAEVERRRTERGILVYEELLTGARDLLARHPPLAARERRRIAQLLVDEFQDTDATQCDLLRSLVLAGPVEERPVLFLVGDPKQSIYGWRNADLAAYEGFVAEVLAAGGRLERLSVSFRSVPALLAEVERLMAPVMVARPGLQPPFQPLVAQRSAGEGLPAGMTPVEHWVSWRREGEGGKGGPKTPSRAASELEARAVARELGRARAEGFPLEEAAILLRSTGDLDLVLAALEEAGVPYRVARDKSYFRRREVVDAAALVRTVLDPADHLALVTTLRSSWVGVPDAALPGLWQRGFPGLVTDLLGPDEAALGRTRRIGAEVAAELVPVAAEVPGLAELAGWEEALASLVAVLARLRHSFAHDPAATFVENLRAWTLIEGSEAARYLGSFRAANLARFFERLAETLDAGGDVEEALRFLRRAVAEAREETGGRPASAGDGAVEILTIHKAKGLDFRWVYLLQTHKEKPARSDRVPAQAKRLAGRWEVELFGLPSPGWHEVEERGRAIEEAERVRLLYVAATRAKDRLVIAGRPAAAAGRAGSFAELLARREPPAPDLAGPFEAGAELVEAVPREVGWRFLPSLLPAAAPPADQAAFPVGAEIERSVAALTERQRRAAERQTRPWRGPVSAEAHRLLEEAFDAEGPRPRGGLTERTVALAVGRAVHGALEHFDFEADPAGAAERCRLDLPGRLLDVQEGDRSAVLERAGQLLEGLLSGPLAGRFQALFGAVVARELPVALPGGETGPVAFLAGAIDLVYRDAGTGALVVADWKTDEVVGEEVEARAAIYAPQLALYGWALAEALDLPAPPRLELWFLAAGRIVEVPGGTAGE
ncbi:MAG TPA: UvrD-helicase domain-containing protein [Thermoanaerobaculia bacterium]|nr:UvrD-helicase domain-containing protein [Thermoanaerobaculia bacterium]